MSKPDLFPKATASGITVDPRTLERVIPESKRSDGTVRKEIKIRPGFTPQEDVTRFRGTRQKQMDANALPKGHIIGWAPPPTSTATKASGTAGLSKSAKKNAKRKEKREAAKTEELNAKIKENWEDDDDDEIGVGSGAKGTNGDKGSEGAQTGKAGKSEKASKDEDEAKTDALVDKLKKLDVA